MSRKGLELPTNTLIVMAVAIVVLLVMIVFFTSSSQTSTGATELQNRFRSECVTFVSRNCCVSGTDVTSGTCDASAVAPSAGLAIGTTDDTKIKEACCIIKP
ncbi:MAG: hypothetical protein HYS81_00795 [Candidatus Aenigmatarchaeota archaeon]|nr:MAG: hypothetical protein HYS81_00795 [Candidatus Aenigmarchaeota archaeon]